MPCFSKYAAICTALPAAPLRKVSRPIHKFKVHRFHFFLWCSHDDQSFMIVPIRSTSNSKEALQRPTSRAKSSPSSALCQLIHQLIQIPNLLRQRILDFLHTIPTDYSGDEVRIGV
jgi:hypothetical protein